MRRLEFRASFNLNAEWIFVQRKSYYNPIDPLERKLGLCGLSRTAAAVGFY
ncbi:MAG: hypothetical protein JNL67_05585 [Planctomycetaceae bacterium]|nr:hypothetical protein [Planctomycetaceae bacterium]